MINQHQAVREQMIGHVANDFPDAPLFFGAVGAQIIVKRIEKEVAVEFITAGIGLPEPLAVCALGPARLVSFPELIPLLSLAVLFEAADVGVGPAGRPDSPGNIAERGRVGSALGYLL